MLTLIVPGLIWTRQALADLTFDLPLPSFTTLLGRGRLRRLPACGSGVALADALGLAPPLPVAALRRIASGAPADDGDWLCLDPVRMHFSERYLILDDPLRLAPDDAEAQALAVSLAPTFAALGRIEVLAPGRWNLRLSVPAPDFPALPEAIGRAATALPLAPAYAPWRAAIAEAQTLLHSHPVNLAREAAGRPPINSLWPWGGGALPVPAATALDALWGDDPVLAGIARLHGIAHAPLPARYEPGPARHALALCDAMEAPARSGDALSWREALAAFEAGWLAPALAALRAGRLDALHLVAPGELAAADIRIGRGELWKFWRKPLGPQELVAP